MQIAYSLAKMKSTEESHLFKGNFTATGCNASAKSVCQKMMKDEAESWNFACKTEDEARKLSAEKGRSVCGVCVSHLYTTYP